MKEDPIEERLEKRAIHPTANRILVLRTLTDASRPMSLSDIGEQVATLDKSSISRVINLFLRQGVVHVMEDGDGIHRYEVCTGLTRCPATDLHPHFYCEVCRQTFCLREVLLPVPDLSEEYLVRSVNCVVKGVCPRCRQRQKRAAR